MIKKIISLSLKVIKNLKNFFVTLKIFKSQWHDNLRFDIAEKSYYPCLFDNTKETGFDRHYIFHTAWAARCLKKISPEFHIDISSCLYFCSLVSAFIPIKFYDYRPVQLSLSGLKDGEADLLKLPFASNSIDSLSCMHVIEHVGLGRYGDPVDFNGDLKAVSELKRVLKKGGDLLFVVPVGKPRIVFNAHRIYGFEQIVTMFSDLNLIEFSLVPDDKASCIIENANPELVNNQKYGCGLFWFKKI